MYHAEPMAPTVCPSVSVEDRARLEAIVADRNRVQKHVARARIILGSAPSGHHRVHGLIARGRLAGLAAGIAGQVVDASSRR